MRDYVMWSLRVAELKDRVEHDKAELEQARDQLRDICPETPQFTDGETPVRVFKVDDEQVLVAYFDSDRQEEYYDVCRVEEMPQ